jgi:hypothetical protein
MLKVQTQPGTGIIFQRKTKRQFLTFFKKEINSPNLLSSFQHQSLVEKGKPSSKLMDMLILRPIRPWG